MSAVHDTAVNRTCLASVPPPVQWGGGRGSRVLEGTLLALVLASAFSIFSPRKNPVKSVTSHVYLFIWDISCFVLILTFVLNERNVKMFPKTKFQPRIFYLFMVTYLFDCILLLLESYYKTTACDIVCE